MGQPNYTTGKTGSTVTVIFEVDGVTYQLRRKGGKHSFMEVFVKKGGQLEPTTLDDLPNSELVNQILNAEFDIASTEALHMARSKVDTIMMTPLPERKFAHH